MEAPENLVEAVNRLKPRAMLLLDTNTIMDAPWLQSYEINAPGPFLVVVPRAVDNELMSVRRGGKDERTRQKASRAYNVTYNLYARGNPAAGIDLGNDRWLITVSSPRLRNSNSLEDDQVLRNLGRVDAALLRLAAACAQDCPDAPALLITRDKDLARAAKIQGLSVCPLSDLRSSEALEKMLLDERPSKIPDIAAVFSDEERPVNIAMTLEELRSDGGDLIARGSGRLAYDEDRFPFRWTFPYKNLASYKNLGEVDIHEIADAVVMPPENVDFMGADEKIPEPVKQFVCGMLEESGRWGWVSWALQSPLTQVRFNLEWLTAMGGMRDELYRPRAETHKRLISPEEAGRYDKLSIQHDRHMQSLLNGTAKSVGRAYRSAFQLSKALCDLLGFDEEMYDMGEWDPNDLESVLIYFLDVALGTWSVGETREQEHIYRPFVRPQQEEEAVVDDEEYEEAIEDDGD